MTSETPIRRRLPRAEREQQMLDVAERLFAERGYHATSMREIGEGVGVSSTMLFSYFDSKEGLFIATAERARLRTGARLLRAVETASEPDEQLRGVVGAFFEMVEEDRHLFEVLAADPDRRAGRRARAHARRQRGADRQLLRRTVPATVDDTEVALVARMLEASAFSVAQWWLGHSDVPRDRVVEQFTASARLLIAGLART